MRKGKPSVIPNRSIFVAYSAAGPLNAPCKSPKLAVRVELSVFDELFRVKGLMLGLGGVGPFNLAESIACCYSWILLLSDFTAIFRLGKFHSCLTLT